MIRRAEVDDVDAMARVHRDAALTGFATFFPPAAPKPTLRELGASWLDELDGAWVDVRGGVVVGTVRAADATLSRLYVDPAHWRLGIARGLHARALEELDRTDVLHLWVLEANVVARRWYERLGWRPDGRRRTVWGDVDDVGYALQPLGA